MLSDVEAIVACNRREMHVETLSSQERVQSAKSSVKIRKRLSCMFLGSLAKVQCSRMLPLGPCYVCNSLGQHGVSVCG